MRRCLVDTSGERLGRVCEGAFLLGKRLEISGEKGFVGGWSSAGIIPSLVSLATAGSLPFLPRQSSRVSRPALAREGP